MRLKAICANFMAVATLSGVILAPTVANAQDRDRDHNDYRYNQNDRRNQDDYRYRDDNRYNQNDRRYRDDNRYDQNDRRYRDDNRYEQRDRTRYHRDQNWRNREEDRRQQTKNEWRNIAIGSGALGVLGLLNHDNTLTFAGTAGALYSLNRYEQDRRSERDLDRARAEYFSRPYFYRDGQRYSRRTVERHGNQYYQFYRD